MKLANTWYIGLCVLLNLGDRPPHSAVGKVPVAIISVSNKGARSSGNALAPDGDLLQTDSLEWMLGKWEWVRKERHGLDRPGLQSIARFCVYPYADYSKHPSKDGTVLIAAEFHTQDPSGNYALFDYFGHVYVSADCIYLDLGFGWSFEYSHFRQVNQELLRLRNGGNDGSEFILVLRKVSVDPGTPIAPKRMVTPIPRDEWADYERRYRQRHQLPDRK